MSKLMYPTNYFEIQESLWWMKDKKKKLKQGGMDFGTTDECSTETCILQAFIKEKHPVRTVCIGYIKAD